MKNQDDDAYVRLRKLAIQVYIQANPDLSDEDAEKQWILLYDKMFNDTFEDMKGY